jgi:hypothetical protein
MEPVAIILLFIVLALMVLFVTRPFFKRQHVRAEESSQELLFLLSERERLLTALQELDFDQTLGKIPAEDYPAQRTLLLNKGAEVLRQLDELHPRAARQVGGIVLDAGNKPKPTALISDDELEDLLAKRRNSRKDKTAGFCSRCGKPVLQSDVFCPSCGNTLK